MKKYILWGGVFVTAMVMLFAATSIGLAAAPDSRTFQIASALNAYEQSLSAYDARKDALTSAQTPLAVKPVLSRDTAVPSSNRFFHDKVKISGAVRAAVGMGSNGDLVFTRANMDLNERNYRLLKTDAYNDLGNTYDPGIYSRLKVVVDAAVQDSVGMHMNITVDPWSYTGKSAHRSVTGSWGNDTINVQYLYWGNTGYTVNQGYVTRLLGDAVNLDEYKVHKNMVPAQTVTSAWGDTYAIPAMKIERTFQPVRELWFDLKPNDTVKFRVFPMAYEDQALTSDDPLKLSNNRSYWEDSPWLRQWDGGYLVHTGVHPNVFVRGYWDRSLAFFTRDSDGQRLTALRGVSMHYAPDSETSVESVIATPKTLWQEYSETTAVPGSVRLKHFVGDSLYVGGLVNMHEGFVDGKRDASNYVTSVDVGAVSAQGIKLSGQVSTSQSRENILAPEYQLKSRGQAYYASLETSTAADDMLDKDYHGLLPPSGGGHDFVKSRLYFARMDQGFESSLSNYHETRDDSFWSRHLTFYPSLYGRMPGNAPTASEEDRMPFAIGNGIDRGREVIGLRADTVLYDDLLEGMGDVRRVQTTRGKYVETVARTAWEYKATDKLVTKALLLAHDLPDTKYQQDPFIVSGETGEPVKNNVVLAGNDPSLRTATVGARYDMTSWAAINGVVEHTNDLTLAEDNFPNGVLSGGGASQEMIGNNWYYKNDLWLNQQQFFDQAPYEYHSIFKTGLLLKPMDVWSVYLDYTRNPNKFAGNIDDNANHVGIETGYLPNGRTGLFARYTRLWMYDINELNNGRLSKRAYNNLFLEGRYLPTKDSKLSLQYGVGPAYTVTTSSYDPNLAYYTAPVLTTQRIVRLVYENKF